MGSTTGHLQTCNYALVNREGAFVGSKDSFRKELLNPDNFYLVNGQLPMSRVPRRIDTCPPKHSLQWVGRICLVLALLCTCKMTEGTSTRLFPGVNYVLLLFQAEACFTAICGGRST